MWNFIRSFFEALFSDNYFSQKQTFGDKVVYWIFMLIIAAVAVLVVLIAVGAV